MFVKIPLTELLGESVLPRYMSSPKPERLLRSSLSKEQWTVAHQAQVERAIVDIRLTKP